MGGQFGDGGFAAQVGGEFLARPGQLDPQLLDPAGNVHGPGGVTEEALDLTHDVRNGEGGELDLAREVEPVDRLDQADGPDLDDVLRVPEVLATAEAGGGEPHQ